jgi:hypothetical protein
MANDKCAVVWRVKWASGAATEHELGLELQEPELLVCGVCVCFRPVRASHF